MKEEENFFNKFRSPIPNNLTPEELKEWEKQAEWDKQEYQRRKKEGMYPDQQNNGFVSRIFRKFSPNNKKDGNIGYGP
jgi:hypothetical protein